MSVHTDHKGVQFGMWLFLYTEIMLFGGLFVIYATYYYQYTNDFIAAGKELELVMGTVNTAVLLTSSLTAAIAIEAMRKDARKLVIGLLGVTILLALTFLCIKYVEWGHKFAHEIFPGSEKLASGPHGVTMFYGLYFTMTGLHALHVIIGILVLGVCLAFTARGKIHGGRMDILENSGLYWHLVDIIWIFLFPLFYLIL
ncbi:MAG: cytochrome c oxidase subunit 3 family protein [Spirochaetes bacterium]|nr:MAG: cytochrome c oxidase subunit 3 family protein [Spirochaetota bacterium]